MFIKSVLSLLSFCVFQSCVIAVASVNLYKPYDGESVVGVDAQTLTGKVMTGYQGWFNYPGDGADFGWVHWGHGYHGDRFDPTEVTVDLWPDISEYDEDELTDTGFLHADGSVAKVFSSHNRKTVLRHFKWMQDYGIDGAFIQRFANGLQDHRRYHKDVVLSHAREGANLYGRTYVVMYDLSGLRKGELSHVKEDWKRLRAEAHITEDAGYQHHEGKPVVSVWGVGFDDGRRYGLQECRELIEFLKADGCTVMLGVPPCWLGQGDDTIDDPQFLEVLALADIVSPWAVGRFGTPYEAEVHAKRYYADDLVWCAANQIDYLPVVFPGFSWHNLHRGKQPLGHIPRLKGKFLWEQIRQAKLAGCDMMYVAMFDEVDEGTAIFKCTNEPPTGNGGKFLTYEGLPSDFYLRLVGEAGKLLRNEIPLTVELPTALQAFVD